MVNNESHAVLLLYSSIENGNNNKEIACALRTNRTACNGREFGGIIDGEKDMERESEREKKEGKRENGGGLRG